MSSPVASPPLGNGSPKRTRLGTLRIRHPSGARSVVSLPWRPAYERHDCLPGGRGVNETVPPLLDFDYVGNQAERPGKYTGNYVVAGCSRIRTVLTTPKLPPSSPRAEMTTAFRLWQYTAPPTAGTTCASAEQRGRVAHHVIDDRPSPGERLAPRGVYADTARCRDFDDETLSSGRAVRPIVSAVPHEGPYVPGRPRPAPRRRILYDGTVPVARGTDLVLGLVQPWQRGGHEVLLNRSGTKRVRRVQVSIAGVRERPVIAACGTTTCRCLCDFG